MGESGKSGDSGESGDFGESGDSGESGGSGESGDSNDFGDIDKSVILANLLVLVILVNLVNLVTMTHCQDHILTENIWFAWSKTSYSGDKRRCYQAGRRRRQTNEQQGKIGLPC